MVVAPAAEVFAEDFQTVGQIGGLPSGIVEARRLRTQDGALFETPTGAEIQHRAGASLDREKSGCGEIRHRYAKGLIINGDADPIGVVALLAVADILGDEAQFLHADQIESDRGGGLAG